MHTVFIHTNNKQLLGAKLSKYSIEKKCGPKLPFDIEIINVDEIETFSEIFDKEILMNGKPTKYEATDLQSFTLSRFMPPELMAFKGKSFVIDPDIFCVNARFVDVFDLPVDKPVGARLRSGKFLSSAMLLDNERLGDWRIADFFKALLAQEKDYRHFMSLDFEKGNVCAIPDTYNDLDNLDENTVLIHNTNRLTQPWKTGLKVDFRFTKFKPIFGVVPREPIHWLLGRRPSRYQSHPDEKQVKFFFEMARSAINDGAISPDFVESEIHMRHIRPDFLDVLKAA